MHAVVTGDKQTDAEFVITKAPFTLRVVRPAL